MSYKGYDIKELGAEDLDLLYKGELQIEGFKENQYLLVQSEGEIKDYFKLKDSKFIPVKFQTLQNSFSGEMKPRNPQQRCMIDLLRANDVPIKLIMGRAGSGKTFGCVVGALEAIQKGKFEKICVVRNNIQVKETDALGALPGDVNAKMLNYVLPFADHCGGYDGLEQLIGSGHLEIMPLGFARGRSIRNSIVYVMEAENLTLEHLYMLMCRVDEGSQIWIDGDIVQRDRTAFEKSQGLEKIVERFSGEKEFGFVELEKCERGPVARLAEKLLG